MLAVQRRKLILRAVVCEIMHSRNVRSTNFQISHIPTRFLFTPSMPPTWRRVITMTSITSLHLMYSLAADENNTRHAEPANCNVTSNSVSA